MKIIVYLGTGGVGKTSVAAATALAQARAGARSLVLTTDPAYRLRTALGLRDGGAEQRVELDPPAPGELWGAMLDVRTTLDDAVRQYGEPELVDRVLHHPIYATIADSLAGMHELMAVERIDQLARHGFENIVVDTAPSRHALEFLDKPLLFAHLVDSHWVKLVGRTYKYVAGSGMASLGRKTLDIYARVEAILGANLAREILDFYSIFVSIAEGYACHAEKTVAMLKDPAITEFRVVTTPQKALRDARYFDEALRQRRFAMGGFYVNRIWQYEPVQEPEGMPRRIMEWYGAVRESQRRSVDQLAAAYRHRIRHIGMLPELERDIDGLPALEEIAAQLR